MENQLILKNYEENMQQVELIAQYDEDIQSLHQQIAEMNNNLAQQIFKNNQLLDSIDLTSQEIDVLQQVNTRNDPKYIFIVNLEKQKKIEYEKIIQKLLLKWNEIKQNK